MADNRTYKIDLTPWENDLFYWFADFLRTSPDFNPNYPFGFSCSVCNKYNIECTTDSGDGWECNFAYGDWLKKIILERRNND